MSEFKETGSWARPNGYYWVQDVNHPEEPPVIAEFADGNWYVTGSELMFDETSYLPLSPPISPGQKLETIDGKACFQMPDSKKAEK